MTYIIVNKSEFKKKKISFIMKEEKSVKIKSTTFLCLSFILVDLKSISPAIFCLLIDWHVILLASRKRWCARPVLKLATNSATCFIDFCFSCSLCCCSSLTLELSFLLTEATFSYFFFYFLFLETFLYLTSYCKI